MCCNSALLGIGFPLYPGYPITYLLDLRVAPGFMTVYPVLKAVHIFPYLSDYRPGNTALEGYRGNEACQYDQGLELDIQCCHSCYGPLDRDANQKLVKEATSVQYHSGTFMPCVTM